MAVFSLARADLRSPIHYIAWVAASVLLALLGPFGWYGTVSLMERLIFWTLTIGASILIAIFARSLVYGHLGLTDFPRGAVLVACVVAILLTPTVQVGAYSAFGNRDVHLPHWGNNLLLAFFISLSISALRVAIGHRRVAPALPLAQSAPADAAAPARILLRLEPALRGDLIRMQVRDHYVDVVTSRGQASLLLRMSDAIAETEGVEGLRVHRSHWVALAAVRCAERADGKLFLTLTDGARVPVSRNYRDMLESRGLV